MTSKVTAKDVAQKLERDLKQHGIKMKGRVHILRKARRCSSTKMADFTYVYEDNSTGQRMSFRSRKKLLEFFKQRRSGQKAKTEDVSNEDMLESWADACIEKSIAEHEQRRAAKEWMPTVSELSTTYKKIVLSTIERKHKIQALMKE